MSYSRPYTIFRNLIHISHLKLTKWTSWVIVYRIFLVPNIGVNYYRIQNILTRSITLTRYTMICNHTMTELNHPPTYLIQDNFNSGLFLLTMGKSHMNILHPYTIYTHIMTELNHTVENWCSFSINQKNSLYPTK